MLSFESRALNSNGHLRTTGRDQVSTRRVPYSLVSYAHSLSNSDLTGLRAPDASGAHRAQRGLQTALTPDAEHQTHSGASDALSKNLS